jgi:hypothetical protein
MCLFYVGGDYNKIEYNTTCEAINNEDILNSTVIFINYEEICYASHDLIENRQHFRRNCCHQSTRQDMRFLFVVLRWRYLITLHGVFGKWYHSRSSLSSFLTTSFIPFLILLPSLLFISYFSLYIFFIPFSLSFFVCFVLTRYILLKRQKLGLCL